MDSNKLDDREVQKSKQKNDKVVPGHVNSAPRAENTKFEGNTSTHSIAARAERPQRISKKVESDYIWEGRPRMPRTALPLKPMAICQVVRCHQCSMSLPL